MIFKALKFVFYGTVIFFALYFFADVRINDVNVRDYLQKTVTPQNISSIFDEVIGFFKTAKEVFEKHSQQQQKSPSTKNADPGGKEQTEPLEVVYPLDKEKLLKQKLKSLEDTAVEDLQKK